MARIVLVINSDTGELIDVAGNSREAARYSKFVHRLLSKDGRNLDFGIGTNDTLIISKGGYKGKTIRLLAKTVEVPESLLINGKTVSEIAASQIEPALNKISGTDNEVDVHKVIDPETDDTYIQISLNQAILDSIEQLKSAATHQEELAAGYITKDALADALVGISIQDDDDLEAVKAQFKALIHNLSVLAGMDVPSPTSSSSSSSSSPSEEP